MSLPKSWLETGSAKAARFYADAAIKGAKIGYFNGMPELIVCDTEYQKVALKNNVPIVGDDCKSQFGGTAINRVIAQLMKDKGTDIKKMYQINYAGNTDFWNLVHRGASKHKTKQEGVTSLIDYQFPMDTGFTHIKLMGDRKTMFLWVDGANFGNAPLHLEAKLEVEDSPNFAGVVVDVAAGEDLLVLRAAQDVDDVVGAKYFSGADNAGQEFLRRNGQVVQLFLAGQTVVAHAAIRLVIFFAKILQ